MVNDCRMDGPPVMWTWVYKPLFNPYEYYSFIYHKTTYL